MVFFLVVDVCARLPALLRKLSSKEHVFRVYKVAVAVWSQSKDYSCQCPSSVSAAPSPPFFKTHQYRKTSHPSPLLSVDETSGPRALQIKFCQEETLPAPLRPAAPCRSETDQQQENTIEMPHSYCILPVLTLSGVCLSAFLFAGVFLLSCFVPFCCVRRNSHFIFLFSLFVFHRTGSLSFFFCLVLS